jgi:hypothetical protein
MDRRTLILTTVGGHILLTVLHALVHVAIPVIPDGEVAAFATVSLYVLPVAGAGLAMSDYRRVGGAALFTTGIASFVFEGSFHFVISNPDHVAHVVRCDRDTDHRRQSPFDCGSVVLNPNASVSSHLY